MLSQIAQVRNIVICICGICPWGFVTMRRHCEEPRCPPYPLSPPSFCNGITCCCRERPPCPCIASASMPPPLPPPASRSTTWRCPPACSVRPPSGWGSFWRGASRPARPCAPLALRGRELPSGAPASPCGLREWRGASATASWRGWGWRSVGCAAHRGEWGWIWRPGWGRSRGVSSGPASSMRMSGDGWRAEPARSGWTGPEG